MPRKFILHIGPPKTGTSSLQEVLFAQRDQLLAQGFDYPAFGRHPKMLKIAGHHGIPERLRIENEMPKGVLKNLARLPKDRTIIFSSEDFSHVEESGLRILAEALKGAEVEIVYYARRWDQLLPSIWQELIKHGQSLNYLEFLNRQVSAPMASPYLNYMIPVERWANVFGKDRIRVFSYDNIIAEGGDIVGHFCDQVLGLHLDRGDKTRDNKRQPVSQTESLRILNRMVFGSDTPGPRVRYAMTKHFNKIKADLTTLKRIHDRHTIKVSPCAPMLLHHIETTFLRRYGAQVENLATGGHLFKRTRLVPTPYVRPDYLIGTPALDLYQTILKEIGERPARID